MTRKQAKSKPVGSEIRRGERRGSHGSDAQRSLPKRRRSRKPRLPKPSLAESKAAEKPAEPVKAVADAPATAVAPDVKKDAARLPGAEKAARPNRRSVPARSRCS
jgi:hypothetical protein